MKPDLLLWKTATAVTTASAALAAFALFAALPVERLVRGLGRFADASELLILGLAGAAVYGVILFIGLRIFGVKLRR
jgi:hypothetical protein